MVAAAHRGHIEIVRQMLAQGADEINSPMTNAALNGHIEIVRLMLAQALMILTWLWLAQLCMVMRT